MVTLGNSHARNLEEPFATIFGHAAAIDFIKANYGTNSQIYANAIKNLQKWRDLSDAINVSYSLLDNLYSRNIPWEEAEPIKQEIINRTGDWSFFPLNNAKIQGYMHYTWHFPLVYEIYITHPDAVEVEKILEKCPEDEDEGVEFLRHARYMSAEQRAVVPLEDFPVDF